MSSSQLSFPEISIVKQELEAARKKAQEIGIDAFKKFFAGVFLEYPELFAIRWQGYTLYFNDGDTCNWSLYGPYFAFQTPVEVSVFVSRDRQTGKSTYSTKLIRSVTSSKDLDNFKDEVDEENEEDKGSIWGDSGDGYGGDTEELTGKWKNLILSLQQILDNEEIMKATFGDHVEVTVTRDSIEIEDYVHD